MVLIIAMLPSRGQALSHLGVLSRYSHHRPLLSFLYMSLDSESLCPTHLVGIPIQKWIKG